MQTSGKIDARWSLEQLTNIGFCVTEAAHRWPESVAVAEPIRNWKSFFTWARATPSGGGNDAHRSNTKFHTITYAELDRKSNQVANGLISQGVRPGTRLALMIPPGIEFVTWVFGLFKAQVVIILIDPGMGRKNMFRCLAEAKPEGLVGIPLAHLARTVFRRKLPQCGHNIVIGSWPGCYRAADFQQAPSGLPPLNHADREQPAAIIFTTGSTGPPKGVLYRHRTFIEQARQIRNYFCIKPGTVDVSGFPLFALFNTGMGATTIFPKMDATRPASVHTPEILQAIATFQADQSFGSPALWNTVTKYCIKHGLKLPTVKRVLTAGAPVSPNLLEQIKGLIAQDGEVYTPYGATEALPVACISGSEVLIETAQKTRQGAGICVGRPFPDLQWHVIRITDGPLEQFSQCELLNRGEIGELMVKGLVVTDQYITRAEANALHKVTDEESFWHRMGDVGYLDDQNRFWFCGRKSHRVQTARGTLLSVPCEAIFENHPHVYRCALVGIAPLHKDIPAGNPFTEARNEQTPVIIVEPFPEHWPRSEGMKETLIQELLQIGKQNAITQSIEHVLLHRSLPVDIRHNAKIFREQLRPWAQQMLKNSLVKE